MVICLERDADLHIAQLMPLPLTVSCFSKIQIGFTFLVPADPGSSGKRAVEWVCVVALLANARHTSVRRAAIDRYFVQQQSLALRPMPGHTDRRMDAGQMHRPYCDRHFVDITRYNLWS